MGVSRHVRVLRTVRTPMAGSELGWKNSVVQSRPVGDGVMEVGSVGRRSPWGMGMQGARFYLRKSRVLVSHLG